MRRKWENPIVSWKKRTVALKGQKQKKRETKCLPLRLINKNQSLMFVSVMVA